MPLNDAILNVGAAAMQAQLAYAALIDNNGQEVTSAARQPITWAEPTGGDMTMAGELAFTGAPANQPLTALAFHDAATAGTAYGSLPIVGDKYCNANGEFTCTAMSIPCTAS